MKSRHGFTLVELLVVIAIITVLAALLLPTLRKARKQAYLVSCMSNQKQLFMAINFYVDDNNGRLPKGYGANFDWIRWWHVIGEVPEYTSANAAAQAAVRCGYLRWHRTRYSGTVWTCPEAVRQLEPRLNNHLGGRAAHYGMLGDALGQRYTKGQPRTILLSDGHTQNGSSSSNFNFSDSFIRAWTGMQDPGYVPWPYQTMYSIWDASKGYLDFDGHMQQAVFTFWDGHGGAKGRSFVTDDTYDKHWHVP